MGFPVLDICDRQVAGPSAILCQVPQMPGRTLHVWQSCATLVALLCKANCEWSRWGAGSFLSWVFKRDKRGYMQLQWRKQPGCAWQANLVLSSLHSTWHCPALPGFDEHEQHTDGSSVQLPHQTPAACSIVSCSQTYNSQLMVHFKISFLCRTFLTCSHCHCSWCGMLMTLSSVQIMYLLEVHYSHTKGPWIPGLCLI